MEKIEKLEIQKKLLEKEIQKLKEKENILKDLKEKYLKWNIKFQDKTIDDLVEELYYWDESFPTQCRECGYPVLDYSHPFSYNENLIWYDCVNCGFEGDYE